jgi:signal transduction histidine kinase
MEAMASSRADPQAGAAAPGGEPGRPAAGPAAGAAPAAATPAVPPAPAGAGPAASPAGTPAGAPGPAGPPGPSRTARLARFLVAASLGRRARAELAYCVLAVPLAAICFAPLIFILAPGLVLTASLVGSFAGLVLLSLASRASRRIGALHRWLAARLLSALVPAPAPFRPGRGVLGRIDARLRDAAGWRSAGYILLKLPLAVAMLYFSAFPWLLGLYYFTYPFWWLILPRAGRTAIGSPLPAGSVQVTNYAGALGICLLGIVVLLIAPWTTRLAVTADQWLIRGLLGRRSQAERIRELEATRAAAVDDSAALLRQVERNLHDGAQARLVALAMYLGRARSQLGTEGEPRDLDRARELLAAAHQGAKEALTELRDLARGIHPPALDGGLEDALASLAGASATPVRLRASIPQRPSPSIETIAYFCAAELLANVAKHSQASRAEVEVRVRRAGSAEHLVLTVTDDGAGGARSRPGGGLAGLAQRAATVDGTVTVASPLGGPTQVTIELPMQA